MSILLLLTFITAWIKSLGGQLEVKAGHCHSHCYDGIEGILDVKGERVWPFFCQKQGLLTLVFSIDDYRVFH